MHICAPNLVAVRRDDRVEKGGFRQTDKYFYDQSPKIYKFHSAIVQMGVPLSKNVIAV